MIRTFFLKEEIWFSSLAENENILFAYFARKSFFFLLFFKCLEFRIISVRPVEALQRQVLGKRKQKLQSVFFKKRDVYNYLTVLQFVTFVIV